jgi:hypothetical protein
MSVRPVIVALVALAITLPAKAWSQPASESGRAACEMPRASDTAKVIVFSSARAEALSTSTIGPQDVMVETAMVTIEPGSEPLYVVGLSEGAIIWRLQGDVGRVERLVLTSNRSEDRNPGGVPLVGATGVAAARVAFLKRADCVKSFVESPSVAAAVAAAEVRRQAGKEPVIVAAGRQTVAEYVLPSGVMKTDSKKEPDVDPKDHLALVAAYSWPAGIVDIDPAAIVASKPTEYYKVLPGEYGLLQLVRSGALQSTKSGDYIIKKRISLPAEVPGFPTFLLPRGVSAPEGSSERVCIYSEETDQFTGHSSCGRRRP